MGEALWAIAGLAALVGVFWLARRILGQRQAAEDRRYGGETDSGHGMDGGAHV
jgi:hypothetical protein